MTLALNAISSGQTAAVQSDQTARTLVATGNPAVQVVCYAVVVLDRSAIADAGRRGFIWNTASLNRQRRTKSYLSLLIPQRPAGEEQPIWSAEVKSGTGE
jgi:hypothetical protein